MMCVTQNPVKSYIYVKFLNLIQFNTYICIAQHFITLRFVYIYFLQNKEIYEANKWYNCVFYVSHTENS